MTWVGRSIRRLEDPALVTGQGRFTADLPAAHWVRFVRSPVAAGRIEQHRRAGRRHCHHRRRSRGVKPITPMLHKFNYMPVAQPILADGVVRFVGEPVAAVIAASEEEAEDIADQVEVDDRARWRRRRCARGARRRRAARPCRSAGAMSSSKAGSRRRTSMPRWRERASPRHDRSALAPAERDAAGGARRRTRPTTRDRPRHADLLDADAASDAHRDRRSASACRKPICASSRPMSAAASARRCRSRRNMSCWSGWRASCDSSVAWTEDRRENLIASLPQPRPVHHARGRLRRRRASCSRCRPTSSPMSAPIPAIPTTCGVEPLMAMAELPGPYDVRAYACVSRGVVTNTCPMAPYRGVSRPVITFALERLMDKAAARVRHRSGRNPPAQPDRQVSLHLRDRPGVRRSELPADAGDGGRARSTCRRFARARSRRAPRAAISASASRPSPSAPATAARPSPRAAWRSRRAGRRSRSPWTPRASSRRASAPRRTGRGCAPRWRRSSPTSSASRPTQIKVVHGDTDRTPYGWGTFASRSLVISGGASLIAAQKLRAKLLKIASHMLEAAAGDIVLEDGAGQGRRHRPRGRRSRRWRAQAYHQTHRFKGEIEPGLTETGDLRSGRHVLQRLPRRDRRGRYRDRAGGDREFRGRGGCRPHHQSDDRRRAGARRRRARHRQRAAGGDHLRRDRQHPHRHARRLPAADRAEIPPIELHHLETLSDASITKAKGLGEGGAIGAPAAVINAINDALAPFGVAIDEMPATPQRIRAALRAATEKRA